jgi:membrane protease YdiL (CAAX protease family)
LLEEFQSRDKTPIARGSWTCPNCGEPVDSHFDICWNCESPGDTPIVAESVTSAPLVGQLERTEHEQAVEKHEEADGTSTRSSWSLWLEVLLVLAIVQPYLGLSAILLRLFPAIDVNASFAATNLWWSFVLSIIIATMFAIMHHSREPLSTFGLSRPHILRDTFGAGLIYTLTAWIAYIANDILVDVLNYLFTRAEVHRMLDSGVEFVKPSGGFDLIVAAILSVCVGFSEELVMRGYMITRMERLLRSTWIAVLFSAAMFSVFHWYQGIEGVWNSFVIGIIFGGVFAYFRRLWPLVIAHATIDFAYLLRMGS